MTERDQELKREAKRIAELMVFQGLASWLAEEIVEREALLMYHEELTPMVKELLAGVN